MNEKIDFRTTLPAAAGTFVVAGLSAVMASGQLTWPLPETPTYTLTQDSSSYSAFEKSLTFASASHNTEFARGIADVYAALTEGQEPLGQEFEAIWDANLTTLYES